MAEAHTEARTPDVPPLTLDLDGLSIADYLESQTGPLSRILENRSMDSGIGDCVPDRSKDRPRASGDAQVGDGTESAKGMEAEKELGGLPEGEKTEDHDDNNSMGTLQACDSRSVIEEPIERPELTELERQVEEAVEGIMNGTASIAQFSRDVVEGVAQAMRKKKEETRVIEKRRRAARTAEVEFRTPSYALPPSRVSELPRLSEELCRDLTVDRKWATDTVALRGSFDSLRFSLRERPYTMAFHAISWLLAPLKAAIINAKTTYIILKELGDILIAGGICAGWLDPSIMRKEKSPGLTLAMMENLRIHFKKPRTGDYGQVFFCRMLRAVVWMSEETLDDLRALQSSHSALDNLRGYFYRHHFARDWSRFSTTILDKFEILLDGENDRDKIFKAPLHALSLADVRVKQDSTEEGQAGSQPNPGGKEYEAKLARALIGFWFDGIRVIILTRKQREKHCVFRYQPPPYEADLLCRLPSQERQRLKERCVSINRAIKFNIELLTAELRTSPLENDADVRAVNQPTGIVPSEEAETRPNPYARPIIIPALQRVKKTKRHLDFAFSYLSKIHDGLEQDLEAINELFVNDTVAKKDVDVLLFYSSLRSHAWSRRWYDGSGDTILKDLNRKPLAVMRQAFNMGESDGAGEPSETSDVEESDGAEESSQAINTGQSDGAEETIQS